MYRYNDLNGKYWATSGPELFGRQGDPCILIQAMELHLTMCLIKHVSMNT